MLLRPHQTRSEILRSLPLALLGGALLGLVAGAASAQLPFLMRAGPGLGGWLTFVGAGLGVLVLWVGLVFARLWLMARTSFCFDPHSLTVRWPGHRSCFAWSTLEAIQRTSQGLRLRFEGRRVVLLFGLGDPTQVLDMIHARLHSDEQPVPTERAA